MKVMMINGSPHPKGNTFFALEEMRIALGKEKYGLPEKEEFTPTNFIR